MFGQQLIQHSKLPNRIALLWENWITPRSTDGDEAFRERTLRGIVPILYVAIIILSVIGLSNGTLRHTVVYFAIALSLIGLLHIMIIKGRYQVAGWLLILFFLYNTVYYFVTFGYWMPGPLATLILTFIVAAVVLSKPRQIIVYAGLVIVGYGFIAFASDWQGKTSPLEGTPFDNPLSATLVFVLLSSVAVGLIYYLLHEFERRRQHLTDTVATLERRDLMLRAVTIFAGQLLRSDSWQANVDVALKQIGMAADVDRVYVLQNHPDRQSQLSSRQYYEWTAPAAALFTKPKLRHFDPKEKNMTRWDQILGGGGIVSGHVKDFPAEEQAILSPQNIVSVLAVPIFANNTWWGCVGFDDCKAERVWSPAEIDALAAVASTLEAAIGQQYLRADTRRERELLQALTDNVPDPIYIKDAQGRFVFANPATAAIMGAASPDELIGKTDYDYYPREIADPFREIELQILQTGLPVVNHEEVFSISDTEKGWLATTKLPIRNSSGDIIQIMGIGRDITERRTMEDVLRDREESFRLISLVSSDYTFSTRITEQGQLKHVVLDGAFEANTGYSPDEFNERGGWRATVHPDDIVQDERDMATLEANQPIVSELRVIKKGGEVRWVRVYAHPVWDDMADKLVGINGAVQDITERKRAELIQKILYNISKATTDTSNLSELLNYIHAQLSTLIAAHNFYVALYDPQTELYTFPFWVDQVDTDWNPQSLEGSLTDYVRRHGKPLLINDETHHDLEAAHEVVGLVGSWSAEWLGAPLKTAGGVIGVMAVQNYETEGIYSEADLQLLAYVAENIAWVIENKQVEEALRKSEETAQRFQQKLKALHEVTLQLSQIESLDALYKQAIIAGREQLGFDRMALFLFDEAHEHILGTYGTDREGNLRNEHEYREDVKSDLRIVEVIESKQRGVIWKNVQLVDYGQEVGHGWIAMAVVWDGVKAIGWLTVDNLLNKKPSLPYQLDLLILYGATLGNLVSQQKAREAINRLVYRLTVLRHIEEAILKAESPETTAQVALTPLKNLIECCFITVAIFDYEEELAIAIAQTVEEYLPPMPLNRLPSGWIEQLRQGEIIVVEDLSTRKPLRSFEKTVVSFGAQAYTIIPLVAHDQLIGTLSIGLETAGTLSIEEMQIAQEVATQLAVGIRQVRLLTQVQNYADHLETMVAERTTQLQEKAQEMEAFTYSVSHDLRAPLRAMDGFSRMLLDHYSDDLTSQARYYLGRIHANSSRMGQLIDDLLALSRIGRTEMIVQKVHPEYIVKEVLNDLAADRQLGKARFVIKDMPPCRADPRLLKHVYVNLITNAIKYSRKEDQPQVEIGAFTDPQGGPVYYVKDNGVGFDMQYADQLFGVFQRLHREQDYEGTGIGLATAKRVISRHRGRIWAVAKPQEGATFFFSLYNKAGAIHDG